MNGKIYFGNTLVSNPIVEGSSLDITTNGTHDVGSYEEAIVDVHGDPIVEMKDVNFYDYDGRILYSYTASEFANLSNLPDDPAHDGLTAQGWNYTLAQAKTYVGTYGKLNIGQSYVTDDGKTRLYVAIKYAAIIYLYLQVSGSVTIDWGDGTTSSAGSSTSHYYSTTGDYVISIYGTGTYGLGARNGNGLFSDGNNDQYLSCMLRKVEIGSNCTEICAYCFNNCMKLETITIPTNVLYIGSNFRYCKCLKVFIAPAGLIRFGQDSATGGDATGAFEYCDSLRTVILPEGMTYCNILQRSSASYGSFAYCKALQSLTFPSDYWGVIMAYTFSYCPSLRCVVLSNSVTSLPQYMFFGCDSLEYFLIPTNTATIGANCFTQCNGLIAIKTQNGPASLGGSLVNNSAAGNDYWKLYVPTNTLSNYQNATNWSSYSSKFITY